MGRRKNACRWVAKCCKYLLPAARWTRSLTAATPTGCLTKQAFPFRIGSRGAQASTHKKKGRSALMDRQDCFSIQRCSQILLAVGFFTIAEIGSSSEEMRTCQVVAEQWCKKYGESFSHTYGRAILQPYVVASEVPENSRELPVRGETEGVMITRLHLIPEPQ